MSFEKLLARNDTYSCEKCNVSLQMEPKTILSGAAKGSSDGPALLDHAS